MTQKCIVILLILELYDKEKAVTGAKNLKNEFKKLLKVAYHVVSAADVGLFTLCVNWFFNSERQTTPQIQQHLTELDKMPTSLGILNYLVRNNFIGYLNYNLLKEFKGLVTESTDWSQNIDLYERKHDEFIHSVSFNTLIEVFQQYPNLAPVSHIGLPEFEIHLQEPWNNKRVYQWTEFFEMYSNWSPCLLVTSVSKKCFVITYAVFPIFVSSVVRDLTNPEVLREFKENGVEIKLSKQLLEMNSMISKGVTNEEDSKMAEKRIVLSKQLSSSDGNVHLLRTREYTSLKVNNKLINTIVITHPP